MYKADAEYSNTPEERTETTNVTQLVAGDRLLTQGTVVTVIGPVEPDPDDFFGRPNMLRIRARREDTGAEGWMPFGPTGVVQLLPRTAPPSIDGTVDHKGRRYEFTGGQVSVGHVASDWTVSVHDVSRKLVLRDPSGSVIAAGYADLESLVRDNGFLIVGEMGRRGLGWGHAWPHGS